ncbi:MAG: hypothetical protein C4524_06040 [Candidatus Zixiibacteriota bacterium]|nr:MAG: hypothetical protein C4524_06040 [candidate division Zixibacteria bacterium]
MRNPFLDLPARLGVIAAGFMLGGSQVLVIRHALALAGGDEAVFALAFALWLLCAALGGAWGGGWAARTRDPRRAFGLGLAALALAVPLAQVTLPLAASVTGWIPGSVPGGGGLLAALAAAVLPLGVAGGALFPLGCRLLAAQTARPVAAAYLLESLGAFLAGAAAALIFAPRLGPLTAAAAMAPPGLILALILLRPKAPAAIALAAGALVFAAGLPGAGDVEMALAQRLRPGQEIVQSVETPYGRLEVTRRHGQITVYENGLLLALSDDPAAEEERAWVSLALHPAPREVLWIGGTLGGAVDLALRHPGLQRLDLVELNPALFPLRRWMTSDGAADDPRVRFHTEDGRRFLAGSAEGAYDLIALNLPGPRSARLAKFYTVEGFLLARRALKPGGVLVFPAQAAEDYLGEDLALYLASLEATVRKVFPQVRILPGETALFAAGDETAGIPVQADSLIARLEARGLEPIYWDSWRLRDRLADSRREALDQALAGAPEALINRDAAPVSFYLQQTLWARQVRGGLPAMLKALRGGFGGSAAVVLAMLLVGAIMVRLLAGRVGRRLAVPAAVAAVGLAGMGLEILALTAYQVQFGSGYREVGLLAGLYMAGLALGAAWSERAGWNRPQAFRWVQAGWVAAPAGLLLLSLPWPLEGRLDFFLYLLALGLLGGLHFPLAVRYGSLPGPARAGRLYALDLAGAALGALAVGFLALPLAGLAVTALGLGLLNLAALILLM